MRENLEVSCKSLSADEVAQLTKLLSRPPAYGIARPSGKWLARQQEKIKTLPETLREPRNPLQRKVKEISLGARQLLGDLQLARPLAERAVLCAVHKPLNSFLVREIFWLLFLEIGSRLDPLRAWPHKSPTAAMFLTRVDSISALVMSKEFFFERFKAAPHDERFVRVESECECCILAAVGRNGRCLADLHAATKLREEHSKSMSTHRGKRPKIPRLARFVSHWIRSMEDPGAIYEWAEEIIAEIRPIQRDIRRHWRGQGEKRPEKASKGKKQRRHVVSLPRAQTESESIDQRRIAALYRQGTGRAARGVYCEDSLVNEPIYGPSAYYPQCGHAAAASPPADEGGEGAFRRPGAGTDRSVYDGSWDHDVEDMDLEPDERGPRYSAQDAQDAQDRVGDGYSQAGGRRPAQNFFTRRSAVPPPAPESSYLGARAGWHRPPRNPTPTTQPPDRRPPVAPPRDQDARTEWTEWTDCTVYTYQAPGTAGALPVPRVPSLYGDRGAAPDADCRLSPRWAPSLGGSSRNARSPWLPPHSSSSSSPAGRSAVNAANPGRLDAEERRKWERETSGRAPGGSDDASVVDVHDSISCATPPRSDVTTLGGLMRRHERGR